MRERDRPGESRLAQERRRLQLVRRVRMRVQEHDRHALDAFVGERRGSLAHAVPIERHADASVGKDALTDAQPQRSCHEWLRRLEQVVPHVIAVLVDPQQSANLEHVAKALGREQADAGALAFQQRIEADRGPVQEVARARRPTSGPRRPRAHHRTARSTAAGSDGPLPTVISPESSSSRIRSVNVPPTSMPMRVAMPLLL